MKTGTLLDQLILIAQIAKTDFALSMNMTPSGLSKILTGKRLPPAREKRAFSRQAAAYFANAIYAGNCHLKLSGIFPVIYDFHSRLELEQFLCAALEYALEQDLAVEAGDSLDYPDRETCYLTSVKILNMFCVILSYHIQQSRGLPMEFFSALPVFDQQYAGIFRRIQLFLDTGAFNIVFHHHFDMSGLEAACAARGLDVLSSLALAHAHFNFRLWQIPRRVDQPFLLLKGQFAMLFGVHFNGMPTMTIIRHKSHSTLFFNALSRLNAEKASYDTGKAVAYLEDHPSCVEQLIDGGVDAVYNFISIGYLLNEEELGRAPGNPAAKQAALALFDGILTKQTIFYVTLEAMTSFCATGKAIVPLLGTVDIEPDRRIAYLQRFQPSIGEQHTDYLRAISANLPKVAVLCSSGQALVYIAGDAHRPEAVYRLPGDAIQAVMSRALSEYEAGTLNFSADLWRHYLDEMKHIVPV